VSQGSHAGGILCVDSKAWEILKMDSLRKRNVVVVEWCCMCKKNEESIVKS
jgi:hypothetical protein